MQRVGGDTAVEQRSQQQTSSAKDAEDAKKTKTFAIPTPLAQWFADTVYEEPTGVVKKEWLYDQYVKFCNERGTFRPKHKQIFSKLVFTVFPRAGSCRLGSIGNQVPYYFGIKRIKRNNNKAGGGGGQGAGKKPITSKSAEFDRYSIPQTRSALGGDESRSSSFDMGQNKGNIIEPQTKIETSPCGKRKRDTPERIEECVKKMKKETGEEEEEQSSEDTTLLAEQLKHRLLELHRTLAQQEAEPYQTDVESYVGLFVENFWPELAPLQWDLTFDNTVPMSEQEMNSFALCLCCSLFCGALVKNDIAFAKDTLLLCSSLVNALVLQTKVAGTSEKLQKNFGVSLLFLARGLVDCSLFQNDIDAVILAKNYCAMAAEIFP